MPVVKTCASCGEKFARTPSEAARPNSNFCDKRCRSSDLEVQGKIAASRTGTKALKLPLDGTVERLYSEGLSCKQIAARYDATMETVRGFLARRGIHLRDHASRGVAIHAPRLAVIPNSEIVKMYGEGRLTQEIAEHFKTSQTNISARLRAEGIEPRKSFFGRGTPIRCKDGHLVRSSLEMQVCNWLWEHRMAHAYEPLLPFSAGALAAHQYADFLFADDSGSDWFIEIWGIQHSPSYDQRRQDKMGRYEAAGISVVSLEPSDIPGGLQILLADRNFSPAWP